MVLSDKLQYNRECIVLNDACTTTVHTVTIRKDSCGEEHEDTTELLVVHVHVYL